MATPRKTATQKATELRISTVGDFKSRMGGIFELPSGLVVKLRNPGGLQAFMSDGSIPNSLLGIVKKELESDKPLSEEEKLEKAEKIGADPKALAEMSLMMNSVAMRTIVMPKVHPKPESDDDRDDELLYVDEIDDLDKQFIFKWVQGGVRDLAQFRKEQEANVARLSAGKRSTSNSLESNGADSGEL